MIFWMKFCGAASGVIARDDTGKICVGQQPHRCAGAPDAQCPVQTVPCPEAAACTLTRATEVPPTRPLFRKVLVSSDERRLARSLRIPRHSGGQRAVERRASGMRNRIERRQSSRALWLALIAALLADAAGARLAVAMPAPSAAAL